MNFVFFFCVQKNPVCFTSFVFLWLLFFCVSVLIAIGSLFLCTKWPRVFNIINVFVVAAFSKSVFSAICLFSLSSKWRFLP